MNTGRVSGSFVESARVEHSRMVRGQAEMGIITTERDNEERFLLIPQFLLLPRYLLLPLCLSVCVNEDKTEYSDPLFDCPSPLRELRQNVNDLVEKITRLQLSLPSSSL